MHIIQAMIFPYSDTTYLSVIYDPKPNTHILLRPLLVDGAVRLQAYVLVIACARSMIKPLAHFCRVALNAKGLAEGGLPALGMVEVLERLGWDAVSVLLAAPVVDKESERAPNLTRKIGCAEMSGRHARQIRILP